MGALKWHQRYAEGIVIGLLTAGVLAMVAYLGHEASSWFVPLFYGVIAASVFLIGCFCFLFLKRLPLPKVIATPDNIEDLVRTWLDYHRMAVKSDPSDENHFRFRITLDSGKQMTVYRSKKEYEESVHIVADLGVRGKKDQAALMEPFTDAEKLRVILDLQLEFVRAKIGYSGLVIPPEHFVIFRRIPILPGLNEYIFVSAIAEVEAAMNLVGIIFINAKTKAEERAGKVPSISLPSTSDSPTPALPEP